MQPVTKAELIEFLSQVPEGTEIKANQEFVCDVFDATIYESPTREFKLQSDGHFEVVVRISLPSPAMMVR